MAALRIYTHVCHRLASITCVQLGANVHNEHRFTSIHTELQLSVPAGICQTGKCMCSCGAAQLAIRTVGPPDSACKHAVCKTHWPLPQPNPNLTAGWAVHPPGFADHVHLKLLVSDATANLHGLCVSLTTRKRILFVGLQSSPWSQPCLQSLKRARMSSAGGFLTLTSKENWPVKTHPGSPV